MTDKESVLRILRREDPGSFLFAPNLWQWNTHRLNHRRTLPGIAPESTQLELIRHLECQVFSRNVYSDPYDNWFGGMTTIVWEGVEYSETRTADGADTVICRSYRMRGGELTERLRYVHAESTLVQEEFLIKDFKTDYELYQRLIQGKQYRFLDFAFRRESSLIGDAGILVAGEVFSPLKLLHLHLGAVDTTYALLDYPDECRTVMETHASAMLAYIEEAVRAGVAAVMSMDNLDTMFHPPTYVEAYSADFYAKAADICHAHGATFFIHACGQQRANLKILADLGIDGLEGVAYPPLGDVELDEAMEITGENFIITGGISAMETRDLRKREEVFSYVRDLFSRMKPYRHRFMLSASCNTAIDTTWETILNFRDAWLEYRDL